MRILGLCAVLALGGCATPVLGVQGPAEHLMQPPAPFPSLTDGRDSSIVLLEAAAAHNKNARKIRGLQKYVRLIQKGK